jgi:tetratricopeptide (TPR) repeat protein
MKSFHLAILVALLAPAAHSQSPVSPSTPAQQAITWAEGAIKENPDRSQSYNDLALAYVRRVRETSDTSYYEQAQTALQKSLQISPENFEARKAEVMILLGRKEFPKALELATALNKKTPDDVMVYGLVADADIELGNYNDAERVAQWMLDMRPGNVPGLLRGARLRRLFGDAEGAMDFYNQAYQQTPPTQTEDLAWILTQMADLQESIGNPGSAEKLLRSALDKFPNYYVAVESLARLQLAEKKAAEAVQLLLERNSNFPTLESEYALAQAFEKAGESAKADAAYSAFERAARARIGAPQNADVLLVHYYLDRGKNPGEALHIARLEAAQRSDVMTLDAFAWALCANGQCHEAQAQIGKALAVGVQEAAFFFHAGAIAARMSNTVTAERFLNESLQLNSTSEIASEAREELQKLHPASAAARALNGDVQPIRAAGR